MSGGWGRNATEVGSNTLKGGFEPGWGAAKTEGKEGPIMLFWRLFPLCGRLTGPIGGLG